MSPRAAILRPLAFPLAAACCWVTSAFLLRRAASDDPIEALGCGFFGLALLVAGAIPAAALVARWFGRSAGSALYFPSAQDDRPPPVYGVAETRRANGDYEEALRRLDEIVAEHPQEMRAYLLMIDIAVVNLRDATRADHALRRGIAALRGEEDRAVLSRMHREIRSRLDVPPPPGPIPVEKGGDGHVRRAPRP